MRFARRHAVPLAAGLAAAVAAFAVVALTTDDGGSTTDGGGRQTPGSGEVADPAPAAPAPRVTRGQAAGLGIFTRMGCGGCHRLAAAGSTGPIGPDLDTRLPSHTRESLTAAILSPPPNTAMPPDFGARMSDEELDILVDFLLSAQPAR
jgi:mono/diheme cytochrome c family protein